MVVPAAVWIVLIAVLAIIGVGAAIWHRIRRRSRWRRLDWPREPSLKEFSGACIDYLYQDGWSYHGGGSRIFVEVCRFRKNGKDMIFLFVTGRVQFDAIQRALSVLRVMPFGPILVVTWMPPDDHLLDAIRQVSWNCISVRELSRVETLYDGFTINP